MQICIIIKTFRLILPLFILLIPYLAVFGQVKDDHVLQLSNQEFVQKGKIVSQRGIHINDFPHDSNLVKRTELLKEAQKIEDPNERSKKINEIYNTHGERNLLFLGKTKGNSQGLFLSDAAGQPKMMVFFRLTGAKL